MAESTQYGLKNHLTIESYNKTSLNLFKVKLKHKSNNSLNLFVLILAPDLIRFHYRFGEEFDVSAPNEYLDLHNFDYQTNDFIKEVEETNNDISLTTEILRIKIAKQPLQIQIFDQEGDLISTDEPGLGFWSNQLENWDTKAKCEIRSYKQFGSLANPPIIYGLGDKTGELNRFSRRFRNQPIDALGFDAKFTDPLYKDIPFFISLDSQTQKAHGIFFDNFYPKFFDFGLERKPSPYIYFGAESGELNYYFFNGPNIRHVVSQYLELTGKPPEWSSYTYGYLGSGMSYTENANSADVLLDTFDSLARKKLGMTAFHLSSGYVMNNEGKRHQFIWNNDKFPNPLGFSEQAEKLGVKLCANVKPVLLCTHPWYTEAGELGLFIKDAQGKTLVVDYWGGKGSYIDFLNPQTKTWWKEKLQTYILANGISGIWNDNNEYEIFEAHSSEGQLGKQVLEMSKLAYETCLSSSTVILRERSDREDLLAIEEILTSSATQTPQDDKSNLPWILSRSGYSGIQKYAQTWTGDNYSSWQSLQYDIPLMSNLGISGIIHCGSDIGGFWGPEPDPELLLRWIQYGVFTPRFCIHSYKPIPTQPDSFEKSHPKFFKIIQKFFEIRNSLIPYIEDAAHKASQDGIPIMRPLVYDFQHDPNTYERSFEYMFGDKYLVAPIFNPESKTKTREIYLPVISNDKKTNTWMDYYSGKKYPGGSFIEIKTRFEEIPIFAQESK